jgi:hypothetical protein
MSDLRSLSVGILHVRLEFLTAVTTKSSLQGCDALYTDRSLPTLQTNVLPSFSGWRGMPRNNKQNKNFGLRKYSTVLCNFSHHILQLCIWKSSCEQVQVPQNEGKFLSSWATVSVPRTLLHGIGWWIWNPICRRNLFWSRIWYVTILKIRLIYTCCHDYEVSETITNTGTTQCWFSPSPKLWNTVHISRSRLSQY